MNLKLRTTSVKAEPAVFWQRRYEFIYWLAFEDRYVCSFKHALVCCDFVRRPISFTPGSVMMNAFWWRSNQGFVKKMTPNLFLLRRQWRRHFANWIVNYPNNCDTLELSARDNCCDQGDQPQTFLGGQTIFWQYKNRQISYQLQQYTERFSYFSLAHGHFS